MKPRIRKHRGYWLCSSADGTQRYGVTPEHAFDNWYDAMNSLDYHDVFAPPMQQPAPQRANARFQMWVAWACALAPIVAICAGVWVTR